jgi:hypothetical protein
MGSQFKNYSGGITTKGSFRQALIIPVWLAVIVLLTATCGNSKTNSPEDESPHSTTAPLTSVAGATPALRSAAEPPGQYVRFDRLTAEDGLSNVQIRTVAQDNHDFRSRKGQIFCCCEAKIAVRTTKDVTPLLFLSLWPYLHIQEQPAAVLKTLIFVTVQRSQV